MKAKYLAELGFPKETASCVGGAIKTAIKEGVKKSDIKSILTRVGEDPHNYLEDEHWGEIAARLIEHRKQEPVYVPRERDAPFEVWGEHEESTDGNAEHPLFQMEKACMLPVAVRGALMPDGHSGYGLPIGGVLACDNAVIPFAVGVDIACRMRMTVYESSPIILSQEREKYRKALERETAFGLDAGFRDKPREHPVMDKDWTITKTTRRNKDRAWRQLGSSGSGNHFVEFGELVVTDKHPVLGLVPGTYLALLSHSGSRGTGAAVAHHYSKLAMSRHPELPDYLKYLSWLHLDSHDGQEYWEAMQLMGEYAAANHECIHRHITKAIGHKVIRSIENHHNFAWKEMHDGQEVIVHRKGATPAGLGVLGLIPGTMADACYVVIGKGSSKSLESSSHGAGRKMSRNKARKTFTHKEAEDYLKQRNVELLSADIDECPMAYKDIETVMTAQTDLVLPVAKFQPRLVKMAPPGNKPED